MKHLTPERVLQFFNTHDYLLDLFAPFFQVFASLLIVVMFAVIMFASFSFITLATVASPFIFVYYIKKNKLDKAHDPEST